MKPLKKYQRLLAVALLSLVTHKALAQSVSSVKPGRNIVTNPGFEENAASWVLDNWMKNEVAADRDNKYPHSGTWSMKVQLTKVVNTPVVMFAFPKLAIRPGSAIQVRFWARGISNGANLSVMIRKEVDPRPTYLRTEMYLTDDWLQYIYTVQLPSDADPATTSLRFALNQTGVFWIDDVEVVELPPMDNSTDRRSSIPSGTLLSRLAPMAGPPPSASGSSERLRRNRATARLRLITQYWKQEQKAMRRRASVSCPSK
jgi:hypothetical protein